MQYNSGGTFAGSSALTFNSAGILGAPATTITSSSATAITVGPSGTTNPAFSVDASTASATNGVSVKSNLTGSSTGPVISATSGAASENIQVSAKGSGGSAYLNGGTTAALQVANTAHLTVSASTFTFLPATSPAAAGARFLYTSSNDTTLTASTEATVVDWNLATTRTHATGAITTQREFRVRAPTHAFSAASTITNAATMSIDGPVNAGTNGTITNSYGLYIPTEAVAGTVTNAFGVAVIAPTLATNNYAMEISGAVLRVGSAPGIAAGTGAGTSPTLAIAGNSQAGKITLTTGTSPATSAVIATITYGTACPTDSAPILAPANAAADALTGTGKVYAAGTTTNFTVNSGSTALAASTAYVWNYDVGNGCY